MWLFVLYVLRFIRLIFGLVIISRVCFIFIAIQQNVSNTLPNSIVTDAIGLIMAVLFYVGLFQLINKIHKKYRSEESQPLLKNWISL